MSNYRRIQDRSRYRKSFFFVTEGEASEEAYLKIVWNRLGLREYCNARFCHEKSSIPAMLATAKKVEKDTSFNPRKGDELWIILDYDEQCHFPEQFKELASWEEEKPYRHVAISSPRFEYWLLMHLDEQPSKDKCKSDDYMQQRIPNFKKLPIGTTVITQPRILTAMKRANSTAIPSCDTPSITGSGLGQLILRLSQQK
ncbi:MAG: RloB domain-containing protein [Akkermansia sp.]|nr:RloB domain-containing protein [Akkermansia sp.]